MAVDHLTSQPAEKDRHDDDRGNETRRQHASDTVTVAPIDAEQRNQDSGHIADGVLPSLAECADPLVTKKVYNPCYRGTCGGDNNGFQKPECGKGSPVSRVHQTSSLQEGSRPRI